MRRLTITVCTLYLLAATACLMSLLLTGKPL